MREETMLKAILTGAAIAAMAAATLPASAQQAPAAAAKIKRTPLQKFDIPGTNYQVVMAIAEIAPNVDIGAHTHPGIETGYAMTGETTLIVAGKPDRQIKPGDSWEIPTGVVHDAKSGPTGAKVLAVYIIEKGKPLATPAK
jgi:quercetin dioxygenase-like cupin family protein